MYRAMIVDDNPWDRKGIQELIDWRGAGIVIVGSFANGKQALEKVEELSPHFIIADVAMPVMNGIQMAQKLKESHPEIKVIFISGYNEFEFVKAAIDLDIYSYVLKPVEAEDLIRAVEKVIRVYQEEDARQAEIEQMIEQIHHTLPLVQEQFFRELIFSHFRDREEVERRLEFLCLDISRYGSIQMMDIVIKEDEANVGSSVIERYLISYTLKADIASHIVREHLLFTVQISEKEYAVILFSESASEAAEDGGALDIAVSIHEKAMERLHLHTVIGISESTGTLTDLPDLYRQSQEAANTLFYGEGNPIIRYGEICELQDNAQWWKVNMEDLYNDVKHIITSGNETDAEAFVNEHLVGGNIYKSGKFVKNLAFSTVNAAQIVLMEVGRSFQDIFDDETAVWKKLLDFDTIVDVRQWLYNMLVYLQEDVKRKSGTRNSKIADDIKEFIKQRYREQITLKDVAETIYLSPKHANSIFKKETGKTICDYLLEYRIEVAKKLLKDPYSKVYQVSEEAGYKNKSHFCLLFKKYTGFTPTEYKDRAI